MTLTYNVFYGVTNEGVILMNLFTVLGPIGPRNLEILLYLDSDDLPCHYTLHQLC
jgi:hypothetical protein